jgi:hypothetical protein
MWTNGARLPQPPPLTRRGIGGSTQGAGHAERPVQVAKIMGREEFLRSCSEVRRFTGLANYYRRSVEGYAELAAPLTALGSPTARFVWTADAQASFDALKLALSSAPVLRAFDPCGGCGPPRGAHD